MKTLSYVEDDFIATLIIKHPPVNALAFEVFDEFSEVLTMIEEQNKVKVVIIKGHGHLFSGGADVKQFTLQKQSESQLLSKKGQQLFDRIEQFHIPIIASIHGAALGGGLELALACHIRIVTETAQLGLPELTLGIIPGYGGTQRLPHLVGTAKAREMILTGDVIDGVEAEQIGLANKVVAEADLDHKTMNLARKIAEKSRGSINYVMALIPNGQFSEGMDAEAKAFSEVFKTADAKEGIQAFIEKRKPNFQD